VIGVVAFLSCRDSNIYDNIDFNFAKDFATRIALTLENSRLYHAVQEEVKNKTEESRKKDEFINVASHELKTPITTLKALTQVAQLSLQKHNDPHADELLSRMNRQVDKVTRLIIDLLDITKIQNGELEFVYEKFDVERLVKDTIDDLQIATTTHKIILESDGACEIIADRNRLSQVIVNLISNAIKYSPRRDQVMVKLSHNAQEVKFEVIDRGIGIAEADQPHIFNRFYKVMRTGAGYTYPGLGLGLYISSEMIKRHGGQIGFTSEAGKGSTFWFTLPPKA
jgi:signal transduction histidine kinase